MKRDIFSERISIFPTMSSKEHRTTTIGEFLDMGKQHLATIESARATLAAMFSAWADGNRARYDTLLAQYRGLKSTMPLAILQGINPERKNITMQSYSNVMCIDIDTEKPDKCKAGVPNNNWVEDWEQIKRAIGELDFVAYCGLSIGGRGIFVLVPIPDAHNYESYWQSIVFFFSEQMGLVVDKSTHNIARLRIASYDPDPVVNHAAEEWSELPQEQQRQPKQRAESKSASTQSSANVPAAGGIGSTYFVYSVDGNSATELARFDEEDLERVIAAVKDIAQRGIDITNPRDQWLQAAGGIAYDLGEQGRDVFHVVAQFHPDYNPIENNELYNHMLKNLGANKARINSFFRLCRLHGVHVPMRQNDRVVRIWELKNGAWECYEPPKNGAKPIPLPPPPPKETEQQAAPLAIQLTRQSTVQFDESLLSPLEITQLEEHSDNIAQGMAKLDKWCAMYPGWAALVEQTELNFLGDDTWTMTRAQFNAAHFETNKHKQQCDPKG